jgi:hypothetical protein
MLSTTKFALGFALSLVAGSAALGSSSMPGAPSSQEPANAGWFGKCLRCEWDPWGGPAYCAVTTGGGFYGCYAAGYKCSIGGGACGKKPVAASGQLAPGGLADAP